MKRDNKRNAVEYGENNMGYMNEIQCEVYIQLKHFLQCFHHLWETFLGNPTDLQPNNVLFFLQEVT